MRPKGEPRFFYVNPPERRGVDAGGACGGIDGLVCMLFMFLSPVAACKFPCGRKRVRKCEI